MLGVSPARNQYVFVISTSVTSFLGAIIKKIIFKITVNLFHIHHDM